MPAWPLTHGGGDNPKKEGKRKEHFCLFFLSLSLSSSSFLKFPFQFFLFFLLRFTPSSASFSFPNLLLSFLPLSFSHRRFPQSFFSFLLSSAQCFFFPKYTLRSCGFHREEVFLHQSSDFLSAGKERVESVLFLSLARNGGMKVPKTVRKLRRNRMAFFL